MRQKIAWALTAVLVTLSSTALASPLTEPLLPAPLPGLAIEFSRIVKLPQENNGTGSQSGVEYVLPIPHSDTLFATSTNGTIYRTNLAGATPSVYLDLTHPPAGQGVGFSYLFGVVRESGLSGVAFHPNFDGDPTKSGYGIFYTASTVKGMTYPVLGGGVHAGETVIQEWTTANPKSPTFSGTSRIVVALAADTASHNVGMMAFNPTAEIGSSDYGKLYIASGDDQRPKAGSFYDPQSTATPGGKILRIDPLRSGGAPYTVPADNPLLGKPGALGEVWAYGLRNPQSFSWDQSTGKMYIDDIGENSVEEVNLGVAGANYGWPLREGNFASDGFNAFPLPADDAMNGFTYPIAGYDHSQGNAIGPGFVYRGNVSPWLKGKYIFSDFPNGLLFYFDPSQGSPGKLAPLYSMAIQNQSGKPECFCEDGPGNGRIDLRLGQDNDGNLLAVAKATGDIYLLDVIPVSEPKAVLFLGLMICLLSTIRRFGRTGA